MSRPGRILIVDDEEPWRTMLVTALQQHNYIVNAVKDVQEALEQLSAAIYHIVVLDIRLPNQSEGIDDLLQELDRRGLKKATKVIILSGFGTLENMRQAFKDHEVADFLTKDAFSPQVLLESVQQVFTQKVQINLALDIQWQPSGRLEDVLLHLKINGKPIKRTSSLRKQLADDLEDLLCRLFYKAEMILVRPLTPGWSGEKVLLIQPFYHGKGKGKDVIMKFGDTQKIAREHHNFHEYVEPFLSDARSTTILNRRSTRHLSGTVYSFLGIGNAQFVDFAHFYRNAADTQKIQEVLSHLFQETCGNWYYNRSQTRPLDLAVNYRQFFHYAPRHLEQIVTTQLPVIFEKEQLTSTSLNPSRKFTNPLLIATDLSLTYYTSTCIVHGDLNPYNFFVDQGGFTWLIDFQSTGPGHILRDFAMLDSTIRFQLLDAQEASLEERLQMEEILCKARQYGQVKQLETELTTDNQALARAFTTIIHLRTLAGNVVAQSPNIDMDEYYVALLYNALNTLQFSSLDTVQHQHALFCASLLVDRLGLEAQERK